jgi:hypothetical protein
MIELTETIVNNQELINEQHTSDLQQQDSPNQHHESNIIETDTLIYSNQSGDDEDFEENPEDDLNEITKMTKEELTAAYLASFYSGNKTQSSLTDDLQLSNIRSATNNSPDRLPTTFNGLAQILSKQKLDFIKKKTWYRNNKNCLKSFEKIDNRLQRECEKCKTR